MSERKRSDEERQKEVDRQLEAMRQAIGDDNWSDSDSDSDDSSDLQQRNTTRGTAMESARKFLWDEVENEDDHLYLGGPFPKKPSKPAAASNPGAAARDSSGANMFRPSIWESHRSQLSMDDSINLMGADELRTVGVPDDGKPLRQSFTDMFLRGKRAPTKSATTPWYDADTRDADDDLDRKVKKKSKWSYLSCLWNTVLWAMLLSLLYVFGYYIYDFAKSVIPEKPVQVDPTALEKHANAVHKALTKHGVLAENAPLEDLSSPQAIALQWLSEDTYVTKTKAHDPFVAQRYALAVMYHTTNGTQWANSDGWMTNEGYCNWYGVQCLGSETEITHHHGNGPIFELNLSANQVKGSIPVEVNALEDLFFLELENNELEGTLPADLGGFSALRMFSISHNNLYGSIPVALLTTSPDLHVLSAGHNGFTGTIPPELGSATKLRELRLEFNGLYGHIPDSVRNLDRLETLHLAGNKLGGSLPDGIFDMARLETLYLHDNSLTGRLSNNFARLTHLELLTLNHNQLKGTIPDVFSKSKFLMEMQFQANELSGTMPRSVCSLATEKKLSYLSATCTKTDVEGELGVHCDCCTECK
mmetsp:Transcript_33660/g.81607  ORF Transcript_33660/g.81607 Transcript_33660/m.81607 type:complete len:589 (+) Transcript_33660:212-1978(+)